MTRLMWFAKQPKKVQKQFIKNCNTNNCCKWFEYWIGNNKEFGIDGITGAFVFNDTKQGHIYWQDINDKSVKKYGK